MACAGRPERQPVSFPPFVDPSSGGLDTARLIAEAGPLAKLVAPFGGLALVPLTVVFFIGDNSLIRALLTVVAQFVLAVGAGLVLMYVVARGIQFAE
jgi:hypothetical protein